jgi:hypothetical protein
MGLRLSAFLGLYWRKNRSCFAETTAAGQPYHPDFDFFLQAPDILAVLDPNDHRISAPMIATDTGDPVCTAPFSAREAYLKSGHR